MEFGAAMDMVVCNTFFKKAENHLVTYASGNSRSQIDYVMVRRTDRYRVADVKAIAGLECVQQHRLVIADIEMGMNRKEKRIHLPRLRLWKLRD